jgi:multicomponent Na+:H+ antiporter subunit C
VSLSIIILIGALFGAGAWLLMQRHLLHLVLGIAVLGHGANLLVVVAGIGASNAPAFIAEGAESIPDPHGDPIPQALVLTAIVIGFGVLAFTLALVARSFREQGSDNLDTMKNSDGLTKVYPAPGRKGA